MPEESESLNLLKRLTAISLALSAERNLDHLLQKILREAQGIANADGGTIYIRNDKNELEFAYAFTDSLGLKIDHTTDNKDRLEPLPLYKKDGLPNTRILACNSVLNKKSINIPDIYSSKDFDFSGVKNFDKKHLYVTRSILTIPLLSHKEKALGCLQLINCRSQGSNDVISFSHELQEIVSAIASQAAIILDNKKLIEAEKNLLESFIKLIAKAIDEKSPYTGTHCVRVPELTEMIAAAACQAKEGKYKDFNLTEDEMYELHIAGWLHDCGKVTTPVHVMDKSTKLETIFDRIEIVKTRFEVLKRDAEINYLKAKEKSSDKAALKKEYENNIKNIEDDLQFLIKTNIGGEFLEDDKLERLKKIAAKTWSFQGKKEKLLDENELYNLSLRRGTLTPEERKIMEGHMVSTMNMLYQLPFPEHLKRVPEYAIGHHERMDGKGYPRGIKAGEMSLPARMMAIADVFEALTAADRPYKPAKKLSESMKIIARMKEDNHLDPDLVDFFVTSKTYLEFAKKFLSPELIDKVDEAAILAVKPKKAAS